MTIQAMTIQAMTIQAITIQAMTIQAITVKVITVKAITTWGGLCEVDLPPVLPRKLGLGAPPTHQGTRRNRNRLLTRPETSALDQVKLAAPCQ